MVARHLDSSVVHVNGYLAVEHVLVRSYCQTKHPRHVWNPVTCWVRFSPAVTDTTNTPSVKPETVLATHPLPTVLLTETPVPDCGLSLFCLARFRKLKNKCPRRRMSVITDFLTSSCLSVASAGLHVNTGRPLSYQVQRTTAPNSPALRGQLKPPATCNVSNPSAAILCFLTLCGTYSRSFCVLTVRLLVSGQFVEKPNSLPIYNVSINNLSTSERDDPAVGHCIA